MGCGRLRNRLDAPMLGNEGLDASVAQAMGHFVIHTQRSELWLNQSPVFLIPTGTPTFTPRGKHGPHPLRIIPQRSKRNLQGKIIMKFQLLPISPGTSNPPSESGELEGRVHFRHDLLGIFKIIRNRFDLIP